MVFMINKFEDLKLTFTNKKNGYRRKKNKPNKTPNSSINIAKKYCCLYNIAALLQPTPKMPPFFLLINFLKRELSPSKNYQLI